MYSLVLLNGGIGSRVGANQPKQFLKIGGIPILVYALTVIDRIPVIDQIVLNFPPGEQETVKKLVEDYAIKTPVTYVEAGETRHESVTKMLDHVKNDSVLIHEAARPVVSEVDFLSLIESGYANVSLMSEIPFTVAPVDPASKKVTGSLTRDKLRNVQLPQLFSKEDLQAAHARALKENNVFTEDATMLASYGYDVYFVDGSDKNIKVTTPTDLGVANHLIHHGEEDLDA